MAASNCANPKYNKKSQFGTYLTFFKTSIECKYKEKYKFKYCNLPTQPQTFRIKFCLAFKTCTKCRAFCYPAYPHFFS